MKITDLSNKQESKIAQEPENLSSSEASKIVGGVTPYSATSRAARRNRNTSSSGCGGAGGDPDNFLKNLAEF